MTKDLTAERKVLEKENRSTEEIERILSPSRLYVNSPWYRQLVVITAGVAMNLLSAVVIATVLYSNRGRDELLVPITVSEVTSKVTEAAGLRVGDVIDSVNSQRVNGALELRDALSGGTSDKVALRRGDESLTITIPKREPEFGKLLGIVPGNRHLDYSLPAALIAALRDVSRTGNEILGVLFSRRVVDGLGTPIRMGHGLRKIGLDQQSRLIALLVGIHLFVTLSIGLAVVNLLPIPALDGGRIIFALLKAFRRGVEVPDLFKSATIGASMGLLMILQLGLTIRDILACFS